MLFWALLISFLLGAENKPAASKRKPPKQLQIGVLKDAPDCKGTVEYGDEVEIKWNMTLFSTKKELASTDEDESLIFRVGYGEVIPGVDQGVVGMCIGEVRKLNIPPSLGYGMRGDGKSIPGGVSISVEITLLDREPRNYSETYKNRLERLRGGETEEDIIGYPDEEWKKDKEKEKEKEKDKKKKSKDEDEERRIREKERERRKHDLHHEHRDERKLMYEELKKSIIENRPGREYKESHPFPKPLSKKEEEELMKEKKKQEEEEKSKRRKKKGKSFPNIEDMGELQPDGSRIVNYHYQGGADDDEEDL